MKPKLVVTFAALLAGATLAPAATNDIAGLIQRGLFEEEANHNLDAAMRDYQAAVDGFDKDRRLAATAIFRLGEIARKQGDTNRASAQYQRVVRDFPEQTEVVRLAAAYLGGTTVSAPGAGAMLTDAAREKQKQLVEEEIKLVEQQLQEKQKLVDAAVISRDELFSTQQQLIELKRQSAALDAGATIVSTATSEEDEEIRRIKDMIQNSPDLINSRKAGSRMAPLGEAALNGQLVVARFLLDHGADIEGLDDDGNTPLVLATEHGHK
ncbi:MAG: ankyrin repeat domain-containing protein, partial [Bryobacteraceae bacterium]